MQPYSRERVARRIRELREGKEWTITDMGNRLNDVLGHDGGLGKMELGGKSGKHTVSQLETLNGTRNITPNIASAYADIFGVTLDYIYCYSNDWKQEYKETKELTGLSDGAIAFLGKLQKGTKSRWNVSPHIEFASGQMLKAANYILSADNAEDFLSNIAFCIWANPYKLADEVRMIDGERVNIEGNDLISIEDSNTKAIKTLPLSLVIPALLVEIQQIVEEWREHEIAKEDTDNAEEKK